MSTTACLVSTKPGIGLGTYCSSLTTRSFVTVGLPSPLKDPAPLSTLVLLGVVITTVERKTDVQRQPLGTVDSGVRTGSDKTVRLDPND